MDIQLEEGESLYIQSKRHPARAIEVSFSEDGQPKYTEY